MDGNCNAEVEICGGRRAHGPESGILDKTKKLKYIGDSWAKVVISKVNLGTGGGDG